MGCETCDGCPSASVACPSSKRLAVGITGNPNCGKSALFNALTGIHQRTGNWPGVTVDRKEGHFELSGTAITVIDTPGVYSLDATSIDEQVTRDFLLARDVDVIVNVVDASNLERNLYFTLQLLEMGLPLVVACNMMDVARDRGIHIDTAALSIALGCPVMPVVAVENQGLGNLGAAILEVASQDCPAGESLAHSPIIEHAIDDLSTLMADEDRHNARWLGLKLLEGDALADTRASAAARTRALHWQERIRRQLEAEPDIAIADSRFAQARRAASLAMQEPRRNLTTLSDRIDRFTLHRLLGVPVFLLVMYLMFTFTINVGGAFIDLFDGLAGALLVDGLGHWLDGLGAPPWVSVLLARGVGGGIQVVATFIPLVTALFLVLSALEDSGYMARAAFVMDRFLRSIGLPGKAFVPLIVGFGCNVPAVMATRTLDNERERKLTVLMNPFMSCSARLPVYVLFGAAFFPLHTSNLVFSMYLIGILAAVLTGLAMKRTLLPGESSGFLIELPAYHRPNLKGVLLRTWDRLRLFIVGAGKIIVLMVVAINILNAMGTDGSFGNEDHGDSLLSAIGQETTPLFAPMGIDEDNWPAVVGLLSGVLAKEVVVGTLDTLYTLESAAAAPPETFEFWPAVTDALATVPENLGSVLERLTDPLGVEEAISDPGVGADDGVFGVMATRFDGQAGAFAYLLFVLLYFPCAATIAVIARETGRGWATFVAAWTTALAYLAATAFYQVATFADHPVFSSLWLSGSLAAVVVALTALRWWAGQSARTRNCPLEA
jgi:ferrous iron transport protein B